MKTLLLMLALSSLAQNKAQPVPADFNTLTIRQIEDDWLKAERTTDPAVLERVLSDDFVNLAPNGLAPGKAELIRNWQPHAGQSPAYTVDASDMRIYVMGETAVAAYVKVYTAKDKGNVAREDTTHVYIREKGTWKLRLSRSSFQ